MDQTWVRLEDSLHKMQSDSNKGLSTLGPFGFSYSLKKKKKKITAFFILLSVSLRLEKEGFPLPLSTSPETGSGQADIPTSQAGSVSLLFISFHLPSPNSKGPLFPIRKLGTTSKGWEL